MELLEQSRRGKPLPERQWRNLLTDLHDGRVAVVVGSELSVRGQDASGTTLYQQVARELARRLGLNESLLPPTYGLLAVSSAYLQDPQNEVEDFFREAKEVFTSIQWPVAEPLLQL